MLPPAHGVRLGESVLPFSHLATPSVRWPPKRARDLGSVSRHALRCHQPSARRVPGPWDTVATRLKGISLGGVGM